MRKLQLAIAALAQKFIGMLPLRWGMELFRISAHVIGVRYAAFPGRHGLLEVAIMDRVIWPLYLTQGALDPGTCELLNHLFKSGSGTLIDVGANVGMICLPAKLGTPGISVYAIEPAADNCECLKINAFRAGISDIHLFQGAAYRRECTIGFERATDNSGDHRIRSGATASGKELCKESSREVVQVQASPLDSIIPLQNLKRPVIVKCDVQGAETDVLAGATRLLDSVDVMIIEFWPYGLKRAGANLDELLSLFSRFAYGAQFDVLDEHSIRLHPVAELVEELRRIYAEEKAIRHYDVVLSKKPLTEGS